MRVPRLRMFAGPNGSGKSTIKDKIFKINPNWLGVYINPDDIEREIAETGHLDFGHFKVRTNDIGIRNFLTKADQLVGNGLDREVARLQFRKNLLLFNNVPLNSYFVSAIADFLHEKLVVSKKTFSFESVMSHPQKIELLKRALKTGFRNYLYFVATEDPEINVSRVKTRVEQGGHGVPEVKIRSRYYRSLDNLLAALRQTDRAYIFDNSGVEATLIAEVTDGKNVEIRNSNVPVWFKKYVLDKGTKNNSRTAVGL